MTRKDFIFIAETIKSLPQEHRAAAAQAFASALVNQNSGFDKSRFLAACAAH